MTVKHRDDFIILDIAESPADVNFAQESWGYFPLIRWEGVAGNLASDFSFRWTAYGGEQIPGRVQRTPAGRNNADSGCVSHNIPLGVTLAGRFLNRADFFPFRQICRNGDSTTGPYGLACPASLPVCQVRGHAWQTCLAMGSLAAIQVMNSLMASLPPKGLPPP
jgi:hypothetical protein